MLRFSEENRSGAFVNKARFNKVNVVANEQYKIHIDYRLGLVCNFHLRGEPKH